MRNVFAVRSGRGVPEGYVSDGEVFIVRRLSASQQNKLDEKYTAVYTAGSRGELPLPLIILFYVSAVVFLCCAGGLLKNIGEVSFAQMYENAPAVFWVGGIAAVVAVALLTAGFLRKRRTAPALVQPGEELRRAVREAEEELCIPADAARADVFFEQYRVSKGGKRRRVGIFYNEEVAVWASEESLCIATQEVVYALPKSSFTAIYRVERRVQFLFWNKEESHNSPRYKPYRVRKNQYGRLSVKPYYSVQFTRSGEAFEILIPPYELETLQRILSLPVL